MPSQLVAIFIAAAGDWSLGLIESQAPKLLRVEVDDEAPYTERASAVQRILQEQGVRPRPCVLALPSTWCLAATLSTEGLLRRGRHEALVYRLEDQLPLDAEQIAADFTSAPGTPGSSGTALGVCVQAHQVAPIIEALEAANLTIASICPAAMLALYGYDAPEHTADANLIQCAGRIDCFAMRADRAHAWFSVPATREALIRQLRYHQLWQTEPLRVATIGLEASLLEAVQQLPDIECADTCQTAADELATRAAADISLRNREAPIDLRRGPLAPANPLTRVRRPLIGAVTALALLLTSIAGVCFWHADGYSRLAAQHHAEQAAAFRAALPGQAVPAAPLPRLRSEARRLAGAHGVDGELPDRPSALHLLHAALEGLPRDLRYRVLELRIDGSQLYLDGHARSHSEADRIRAALRDALADFDIAPPRTENLPDRGVSFTLTGQRQEGQR